MNESMMEEVPVSLLKENSAMLNQIDMNEIVGQSDILFICLDTLRYDIAKREEENNNTPNLNQYGKWQKCNAPGNFTYPSHHAMFAGFLPSKIENKSIFDREILFFQKDMGLGRKPPENSFAFEGATFIQGLEKVGYETICIGGVGFFNKRTDIGKVFPSMFKQSYWNPSFSCSVKESAENQIDFAIKKLKELETGKRLFMYINIDAIHYPNYFYLEGAKEDDIDTHAAALRYVDSCLPKLFSAFKERNKTFVIACSDHGTCYGEDGYIFHGFNNDIINTVPYKHFIL